MTLTIKHAFVSGVPDGEDTSVVRPSNWNADHLFSGILDVSQGGTGHGSFSPGYFKSTTGTDFTTVSSIPASDISGSFTTLTIDTLTVDSLNGVLKASSGLVSGSATTSDLPEGSNLYFTNERVDDEVATLIQNGTGLTWTYNDIANTLTGNVSLSPFSTTNLAEGTNLYYTDARARAALSAGTAISYNNTTGVITNNGIWSVASDASNTLTFSTTNSHDIQIGISNTYPGQTSIVTLGTVTTGIWHAGVIDGVYGGTGHSSYTVGDLLCADSGNSLGRLTAVVTGNALISGGVGLIPSWGKIGLTTHISGILAEANGGTNQSSYTLGDILYASASNTLSKLAGNTTSSKKYLSQTGTGSISAAPSWSTVDALDLSGVLQPGQGGTGTGTAFSKGAIVVAGASGFYTQDFNFFFWDATNHRLGIGTSSPSRPLHISTTAPELQFTDTSTSKDWHIGGNTNDFAITETGVASRLWCIAGGNIGFNGTSFGGGAGGVIFIGNCTGVPGSNPSGGGVLYVLSGALKYRGSGGTVTNIAAA